MMVWLSNLKLVPSSMHRLSRKVSPSPSYCVDVIGGYRVDVLIQS